MTNLNINRVITQNFFLRQWKLKTYIATIFTEYSVTLANKPASQLGDQ